MRTLWIEPLFKTAIAGALLSMAAGAQDRTKGAVLQKLEALYVPTKTTDDQSDIVTAGSILTLKKDNLVTVGLSSGSICPNTYKDGRISQSTVAKVTCGRVLAASGQAKRRVFLAGQKLWVTSIDVKDGGVTFQLYTDAYLGERYKASLTFSFGKAGPPSPEEAAALVAEAFKADPPPAAADDPAPGPGQGQPGAGAPGPIPTGVTGLLPDRAARPAAREDPLPPIEAPPPIPAEPQTISLGMSQTQVGAILGRPERIVKLGTKEIYSYTSLKVTFVNNKVTDVE